MLIGGDTEAKHPGGSNRRDLLIVLGVAAAVRLACWFAASAPTGDEASYQDAAWQFVTSGKTDVFWPPGTSWLIAVVFALCGPHYGAARLVWVAIDLVNVGLIHALGRRVQVPAGLGDRGRRVPMMASLVYSVYVPAATLAVRTTSEIPAALLVLSSALLLVPGRSRRFGFLAASGLASGFLVLFRPSLAPIPFAMAAWLLAEGGASMGMRLRRVGLFSAFAVPLVAARVATTFLSTGLVSVSTNTAYNLYVGNAPAYQDDLNLFSPAATPSQKAARRGEAGREHDETGGLSSVEMNRQGMGFIWRRPGLFLRRASGRLARVFAPKTSQLDFLGGEAKVPVTDPKAIALLLLGNLEWGAILAAGVGGIFSLAARAKTWSRYLSLPILGSLPLCLVAISKPRYSFPFEPFLILAAAVFVAGAPASLRSLTQRRALVLAPIYIFLAWSWLAWLSFAITSRA